MEWHWKEFPSLLLHLPDAVHDLLQHEDKTLVEKAARSLRPVAPAAPPAVSIEKDLDAGLLRSQQNMLLLAHDYLHTLPDYIPESKEAELLIQHWNQILLEQPKRVAEFKLSPERARQFWQERLRAHRAASGMTPENLESIVAEWDRATPLPHPTLLGDKQTRQWQQLVIRNRLASLTGVLYWSPGRGPQA